MQTLAIVTIAVALTLAFYRPILKLLQIALFAGSVYLFLRAMIVIYTIDYQIVSGAIVGGIVGFLVVGVICGAIIRHTLIHFYLDRAIARDREAADAGKLW